jgi:predicted CXXCH cytochrome family protein
MKFRTFWLGAAALVGLAASGANAQITNSAHDFSSYAWSGGEICKPCHTPHFAVPEMPRLWNHELTNATYTLEGGGTMTAEDDFDKVSRMCMSCHDGTVALDSFGGQTGANFIPGSAKIGTDLADDHPVGSAAEYPPSPLPSWWNGAFRPTNAAGTSVTNGANTVSLKSWLNAGGATRYVVGCTTCHNAHNRGNFPHMTSITNAASAMCLTCHIK